MGADEDDQAKLDSIRPLLSESVTEKLDAGWVLSEGSDGQLLLVPPPTYGEPA